MNEEGAERWDVLVVGAGTAGFEAAVAAAQGGARRVLIVEKASEGEGGGNARFSHTGFRFAHAGAEEIREFLPGIPEDEFSLMEIPAYPSAEFLRDLEQTTGGLIDPKLAAVLAGQSNAAVHWMLDLGIEWQPDNFVVVNGRKFYEPGMPIQAAGGIGGGMGQLAGWRRIAAQHGVEVRYDSRVTAIRVADGVVRGLVVDSPSGSRAIDPGAVILCSGGFQASRQLRARHLGPNAELMKVRGSRHDSGEVLELALEIGAARAGEWSGAHVTPVDARFPDVESSNRGNRYSYLYGITVNRDARRFFDEGETHHSYTYAKTGWKILAQPDAIAYQIFDQVGLRHLKWYAYEFAVPTQADAIRDLALQLDLDPDALERTVEDYNAATQASIPFDPGRLDGKGTVGLAPPKSNWATPIAQPPFVAYPVTPGITFTFGGLRINEAAEVVREDGRPIRGLYASGDIIGLFHRNYPSGSGQTRNAVFSRIAGRGAAQLASSTGG